MVRQLFEVGVLQSGFWHQFAMTAHSPVLVSREFGVVKETEAIGTFIITILIILIQQRSIMINFWTQEIFVQFHARNLF
jgi:hypothetical protein